MPREEALHYEDTSKSSWKIDAKDVYFPTKKNIGNSCSGEVFKEFMKNVFDENTTHA